MANCFKRNAKIKMTTAIRLGGVLFSVVDLTEPLRLNVEVFPGDPKPIKKVFSERSKTGYQHHIYEIGDHTFHPHGDAPKHQNNDSRGFEEYSVEFNEACLIDLSDSDDAIERDEIKYLIEITEEHLKPY